MALRCLSALRMLTKNNACVQSIRRDLIKTNPLSNKTKHAAKEFKTERNVTYLEDPDTFGTLSKVSTIEDKHDDEGDIKEENFQSYRPLQFQKLTTKQYADIIKQYVKHKRLKEAIDVLEVRMLKEDRVKPENYIYNILIGACAEVGYTKKAFKLYNDMKKRALKPTGDTYTCLFEACIHSPWKENGLKYAKNLRNLMIEKGIEPNLTNYNVMIKAFGRCGDLPTAFKIVDEMIEKKIKIRVHTLNHLLHACISDKETGFRHALLVWRKMLKLREKPNIYSFNLMLKCVKDCNLGNKNDIEELIGAIREDAFLNRSNVENNLQISSDNNETPQLKLMPPSEDQEETKRFSDTSVNSLSLLENSKMNEIVQNHSTDTSTLTFVNPNNLIMQNMSSIPNLLSKSLNLEQVCGLQEVTTVQEKFAVIGGQDDFLQQMAYYSVKPDIKTFTQMLTVIDDDIKAEEKLIKTMKEVNVKPDIDFFNMLIKKRCFRSDYDNAFAVKDMIELESKQRKGHPLNKKNKIKMNIMTYGALAMACKTKEDAEKLLHEMEEKRLKVNIEILGSLLRQGTAHVKFDYVSYILKIVKQENLKVNVMFMNHLEAFIEKCDKIANKYKEEQIESVFILAYNRFYKTYQDFLRHVDMEEVLKIEDPWQQFRESHPDTVQREAFKIIEPKKFYKRNRKFIPYVAKT